MAMIDCPECKKRMKKSLGKKIIKGVLGVKR